MTADHESRPHNENTAGETERRLRKSVRRGIWKRLLRRSLPALLVFVVIGSALLEAAKRFPSTGGVLQSPAIVLVLTVMVLCPLIIYSVRQVLALAVNLEMAHLELLGVITKAIAKRDDATGEHNLRVAIMAVRLGIAAGLDRGLLPGLFTGALLHDVGKIGVPDGILLKPGKLSPEERQEIERHVIYGDEILADSHWLCGARQVVHYHHEHFDGSGYPEGMKGNEIPPVARVFAIVDVFDALTSSRPYKPAMDLKEAVAIIERGRGTHFDPAYVDAFKRIAGTMHAKLVDVPAENLKDLILELIENYYALVDPRSIDF